MNDAAPEIPPMLYWHWHQKAALNVESWGLQDTGTILLAMQEELGELTQAYLEAEHEGADPERIGEELDDLGALLLQLYMRQRSISGDSEEGSE